MLTQVKFVLLVALIVGCSSERAANPHPVTDDEEVVPEKPPPTEAEQRRVAKARAEELTRALVAGDYHVAAGLTYSKIIRLGGGTKAAMQKLRDTLGELKATGATFRFEVSDPTDFARSGRDHYLIVPTKMITERDNMKRVDDGYLLAISHDRSETWHFAADAGLRNQEQRAKILPDLPKDLPLPILK
ncbi:MAG: hypothetical protein FJ271_24890 [Planctomycetes bacterium]|nr:hypothetical protein [Planctomycetota bacterium]